MFEQAAKQSRRQFLRTSALLGAGTMAGRWFSPSVLCADDVNPNLNILTGSPMNAEPEVSDLLRDWITPAKYFYIRSHAPNPQIDPADFRLKVEGLVEKPLEISLADLKQRYKQHSAVATMTCAGNRRKEYNEVKPVGGVQWGPGAIGNAEWGGVLLSEVLKAAGVKDDAKHVWFEGLDQIPKGDGVIPFGGSIPLTKAFADTDDMPGALLCFEMNGSQLTPDHGFPLRTVVPGYIGARSVKWLGKIVLSNRPSPNHYVDHAYKLISEDTPLAWDESGILYNFPVNSVIGEPKPGAKVAAGRVKVRGYALPKGDGSRVKNVEVTSNGGRRWTTAKLLTEAKPYCWVHWEAEVPVRPTTRMLHVRAADSKGSVQPRTVPWNVKGYMNNSWYDLPIDVTG